MSLCFFWPGIHNFRDIVLKFCIFASFHILANYGYKRYERIQNFSPISLKLCLVGQKKTQGHRM